MAKGKSKKGAASSKFLSNTIVVKFHDQMNIPYTSDTEVMDYLMPQFGVPLANMLKKHQETSIGRMITSITPLQIDTLVAEAQVYSKKWSDNYTTPNFHNFFKIECKGTTPVIKLLNKIQGQKIVEYAYVEGRCHPASKKGKKKSLLRKQGYLNAAPHGINAKYAWKQGVNGAGNFKFIDIEDGWDYLDNTHNDLPDSNTVRLIHGVNAASPDHGNKVLGIILAKDNGFGVKGIAPSVNASVVSQYSRDSVHQEPADAIAFAGTQLRSGDILLIELQYTDVKKNLTIINDRNNFPLEFNPCVFHMIKNATRRGVIVVEAAGNAKADLDTFKEFDRTVKDSGAIMVGSAKALVPHKKISSSNHGTRIDCYAWGEKIATTRQNSGYILSFGETSGASAIIAGAAISVQSMYFAKTGNKLDSKEMREILSDKTNGTSSPHLIGVMPDLKKIAKKINAAPATAVLKALGTAKKINPARAGLKVAENDW